MTGIRPSLPDKVMEVATAGESEPDPEVRMEGMMNDDTPWDVVGLIILELRTERFEYDELFLDDLLLSVENLSLELLFVEFAVVDLRLDDVFPGRLPTSFCGSELLWTTS
jgi:hypothetical protein